MKDLFSPNPKPGRVFIQEPSISQNHKTEIYQYEKASEVINNAKYIAVGICYCRHKMEHLGKKCHHEQKNCLTFNSIAESLISHKFAKSISKKEAKKILDESIKAGLVQFGEGVQDEVQFICNCCGCCCEALNAYNRLGHKGIAHSNYTAQIENTKCTSCGLCVIKCPVNAITQINKQTNPIIDKHKCIGCGVCSRFCVSQSINMTRHKPNFIPKDEFERIILEAIDKNKLENYIFDSYDLWNHKSLRRLAHTILHLPETKKILFNKQVNSNFFKIAMQTKEFKLIKEFVHKGKTPDYSHPELKSIKNKK